MFEFQIGHVTQDNETNFKKVKRLLKFFLNLIGQVTRENKQCLDFKMGRSPRIMRPISGKHRRLLKFFRNLNGQVARQNRLVFGFQNG